MYPSFTFGTLNHSTIIIFVAVTPKKMKESRKYCANGVLNITNHLSRTPMKSTNTRYEQMEDQN